MLNFFHQTNLSFLTPELKKSLLELVDLESDLITTDHKLPTATTFIFFKLPQLLQDTVLNLLPAPLVNPDFNPFIRVQYTAGGNIQPHIDNGRISGILTVLSDDRSQSDFYKWVPGASQQLVKNMLVKDINELVHQGSVVFEQDKTYLYNHAAIHDVTAGPVPRITLNILYQSLPYNKLVEIYSSL
jgi:hypothetical protein